MKVKTHGTEKHRHETHYIETDFLNEIHNAPKSSETEIIFLFDLHTSSYC